MNQLERQAFLRAENKYLEEPEDMNSSCDWFDYKADIDYDSWREDELLED